MPAITPAGDVFVLLVFNTRESWQGILVWHVAYLTNEARMSDIFTTQEAGVLTIAFNREAKKNAITATMYDALSEVLVSAAADREVRVVLIRGSEQVFSAGNDLGDFIAHPPATEDAPVWRFLRTLSAFPKPIVAAVCGVAVGVGTTLLLHCDLVYAGTNARFSVPFVSLGLCPEAASSLLLPKLFGHQGAAEALLTGEPFDAEFALQSKLVNRVLPPEAVLDFALSQARKIAQQPSSAVMETKRLLKLADAGDVLARINEEAKRFAQMLDAEAAREAIAAFTEKRKPDFSRF